MSVSTKAIIRKDVSLEEVMAALKSKFEDVELISSNNSYFFRIAFFTK